MDDAIRQKILAVLDGNRIMSLATLRPDGWPQATVVGYAREQLTLYFLCGQESQKAHNLGRDRRVSLTIGADTPQVMAITGLSMAAEAEPITDPAEAQRVLDLLMRRYPPQADLPGPVPPADTMAIFRLRPVVISLIDYTKGFGHADLVTP
jgi:nitroimidazol reductase NimA-like FMN-containing flavoprotein (pyridoxamine 5'-phosphate oxidase superfamily)